MHIRSRLKTKQLEPTSIFTKRSRYSLYSSDLHSTIVSSVAVVVVVVVVDPVPALVASSVVVVEEEASSVLVLVHHNNSVVVVAVDDGEADHYTIHNPSVLVVPSQPDHYYP